MLKPFLKWPGNKYKIIDKIKSVLPEGKCLVEPFVGAASLFLNTNYDNYILNDINPDLINLYITLKKNGKNFIEDAKYLFKFNTEKNYYKFRKKFNNSDCIYEKSCLFVFLNRHGYNGLCRYNLSKEFNVPYGFYSSPYFPQEEMENFYKKLTFSKVKLLCQDFSTVLKKVKENSVVYCDPPYLPLNLTSNFTSYYSNLFGLQQQINLAELAFELSKKGITVIISNHFVPEAKNLYSTAEIIKFSVQRYVSCKSNRKKVQELLAIFS